MKSLAEWLAFVVIRMTNASFQHSTSTDATAEKEEPEPQLRAWHCEKDSPVLWVHPIQPLCATTQLCSPLTVQFPSVQTLQTLLPESLRLSLTSQTEEISPRTETVWILEAKHMCGWASSFNSGMEGVNPTCLWVQCCETSPHTRGHTGTPKGLIQSWSLWIFSFSLVNSCKSMRGYTLRRCTYRLRKHRKPSKDRGKQGFKDGNMQNI